MEIRIVINDIYNETERKKHVPLFYVLIEIQRKHQGKRIKNTQQFDRIGTAESFKPPRSSPE